MGAMRTPAITWWDHPREYGENSSMVLRRITTRGSSPRIRGKSEIGLGIPASPWIIPANTGKIENSMRYPMNETDHPREYGENRAGQRPAESWAGSSPRIRGKCVAFGCWSPGGGIIPANTGKIYSEFTSGAYMRDHPREYGENQKASQAGRTSPGSSPRIRGKFFASSADTFTRGIIPANTGKIGVTSCLACGWWDHPREYGENSYTAAPSHAVKGSSPRIRGKSRV